MGTESFPGVKWPGRGVDHPLPSSTEVKERVELYLCSPSGPSWPVLGRTLPLPYLQSWAVHLYGQSSGSRLSISLRKYVTVFQAEIYAILACVYEIQAHARSEKYISICSDSQAALKALQAAETTSQLVRQCQRALNDISTHYSVGLFWVPGHTGIRGHEIADELARGVLKTILWDQNRPWESRGKV
jgi:ribonuclease HI